MSCDQQTLGEVIAGQMPGVLPKAVAGMADHIRKLHGTQVVAVLAYGSCLRGVDPGDSLIDFYVLTRDLNGVSGNPLSRLGCRFLPPNVHYAETMVAGEVYRAKYAVLPLWLFERKVSVHTSNPYFWARFAQPCAIVFAVDDAARGRVTGALATACATAWANFAPLAQPADAILDIWVRGFKMTYGSELRSEGVDRAQTIVESNAGYYRNVGAVLTAHGGIDAASGVERNWPGIQRAGKFLSALRLIKATFTFQGGADYIAWKISRHSGQPVELSAWQRRHPILAAITLLPKLMKSGAVR